LLGQAKHEIIRESLDVSLNRPGEIPGLDAVELGQVMVEHDLLAADEKDSSLDALDWDHRFLLGHKAGSVPRCALDGQSRLAASARQAFVTVLAAS
jgi:hypothetical protein